MDIRFAAALVSSRASIISFQVSTRKWLTPEPLIPPNWFFPSETSLFSCARTKLSRHLEKSGVQDKFRSCARESGLPVFGISVTVSVDQIVGHSSCSVTWQKMVCSGIARRSANAVTSLGSISPATIDLGFFIAFNLADIWNISGGLAFPELFGLCSPTYSCEMRLKNSAAFSAMA